MSVIAVVGSRHFTDYEAFCAMLRTIPSLSVVTRPATRVISGGQRGVDKMAAQWAGEHNIRLTEYLPDDSIPFTEAAHARNQQIVDDLAECRVRGHRVALIALPGPRSKGTYDTIRRAKLAGIKVIKRDVPE